MIPMKIKGWLPKAAGEAMMLPKEITLLTGSDFDIDKIYVMLKEFQEEKVNVKKYTEEVLNSYKKAHKNISKEKYNNVKRIIAAWIKELNEDGKITSKFADTPKGLQKAIEKLWDNRSLDSSAFTEKTASNLGGENRSTRNNEIFDIQWAVLTNEDTLDKMFNPGSFDVQKKTAAIIKARKAGVNKSYKELSKMKVEELEALSEHNTGNIIYSTTQVAFHKQNMTAGKLIGIFANNNTSHAFLSMQNIHINFGKDKSFTIDGHTVSNTENNKLDPLKAFNGSLISKNIAGFLAASVDAVKDPVLNFMNLNTFTSGPAMLLARLGFDSDTIGLLLTQPIIEKVSEEYFKQNNEGYVSVESIITETLDKYFKKWQLTEQQIPGTDFTKDSLLESLTDSYMDSNQAKVLLLFKQLSSIATNLNTLTFITKFNSISNAVGPTIADTMVMKERISKFENLMKGEKPPFTNGALPEHILGSSPILKAFYKYTMGGEESAESIFKPYFPHYSTKTTELLTLMRNTTKAQLDAKTINKLINDFILYKLTAGNNPIINTNPEQRNRFINRFVKEFKQRAEGLVDNDLINIISFDPGNNKCPIPTLNAKTGGFNADMQEKIKIAWTSLMENPDTFELGRDLFLYNLYRSGFTFSPKTFLHLASVDTKLALGNYIDSIADVNFNDDKVTLDNFLLMFRRNHSGDRKIVPELPVSKQSNLGDTRISIKDGKLTISYKKEKTGLESIIAEKKQLSTVFAPVVVYNDKLYYTENYDKQGSIGTLVYTEIKPLGIANNFLEYNANESAEYMETVIGKKTKEAPLEREDDEERADSDREAYTDRYSGDLTREDIYELFAKEEAPLAEYVKEIIEVEKIYKDDEIVKTVTIELMDKFIEDPKSKKKAVREVKEIRKKFCKI